MIRCLLLMTCLLTGIAAAAEVFRWVDDDGQIHYSDRPHEGAESVVLPEAQTFTAPPVVQRSRSGTDDSEADKASKYRNFRITNPADGQADWDIPGDVTVRLSLTPKLQRGHTALLYMDGETAGTSSSGDLTFQLTGVLRGTHSLRAVVQDADGKSLIESSPVNFTVHKTSLLNPNNPFNAPPPVAGPR